jgi:hypothetical protein
MDIIKEVPLSHEQAALIARALYTLSRVDGHEEREGMLIKSFWMEVVGDGSVLDLKTFETMPDVTGQDLARGLPTPDQRNMFMKTAVMLTYADGNVSDKEKQWVATVGKALGLSDTDVARIDELVRTYLLSQLSHLHNVDALKTVAKDLGLD